MKNLLRLLSLFALFSLPLAAAEEEAFSQAELDQMLAPIALYPDSLLAQILTASTYPLEVVQASRWSQANPELKGAEAVDAVDDRDWDPSVKALVAFPDVLRRMDEDLEWTQELGNAVLLQEEEVMSSVQGLREKAYAAGSLDSLENVRVHREREVIYIEPAEPRVVYVPYYRPTVVYGSWWWPAYPPVYWGPPATVYYSSGGTRFIWTTGVHISTGFFYSRPDWHRRHIVVHHHHHNHYAPSDYHASTRDWSDPASEGKRWRHEPAHRRGVSYRSTTLEKRYGLATASSPVEQVENDRRSIRYAPRQTELENRLQAASGRTSSARESASLGKSPARERAAATESGTSGIRAPVAVTRKSPSGVTVPSRVADSSNGRSAPTSLERRVRPPEDRRKSIAARLANERVSTRPSRVAGPSSSPTVEKRSAAPPPDRRNSSNLRKFSAPSEAKPTTLRPAVKAPNRKASVPPQARPSAPAPQTRPVAPAPQARKSRPVQASAAASSGVRPPRSLTARSESTDNASSAREAARSLGRK